MIRPATHRRSLFAVAVVLVGLLAMPIDECDDYGLFSAGAARAHAEESDPLAGNPDQEHDSAGGCQHACCCLVCELTTDDAFAPSLPAPQRGEKVSPLPVAPVSTAHLPAVFRPPIA